MLDQTYQYSNCSGRKRALFVGINYKGEPNELQGCVNDAKNMCKFMMSKSFPLAILYHLYLLTVSLHFLPFLFPFPLTFPIRILSMYPETETDFVAPQTVTATNLRTSSSSQTTPTTPDSYPRRKTSSMLCAGWCVAPKRTILCSFTVRLTCYLFSCPYISSNTTAIFCRFGTWGADA